MRGNLDRRAGAADFRKTIARADAFAIVPDDLNGSESK
jgi:hypothetical protein